MGFQKVNHDLISDDVENLTVANLNRAFKRYKRNTSRFRNKNVRDPLDHLDFELNLKSELENLVRVIERGDYHPKRPLIHFSPKKNGISRPTVDLHIEDTIVYRFCVENIDKELLAITRQENIRGGVMASPVEQPEEGDYYEKWFKDWLAHNRAVKAALEPDKYLATSDVSSYFDNIEIEVLIDMLREAVKGKRNLISLLSLFLHGIKLRYTYATRLNTGLVQDDSDGSRILAYFYLHQHDIRMINFAKNHMGHYFRYADDMNVVVENENEAKQALALLTNSLRRLGLTASVEKTTITPAKKAYDEMLFEENEAIEKLSAAIDDRLRRGGQTKKLRNDLQCLYSSYKKDGVDKHKNWIKLLKRFYTLGTRLQDDFLFDETAQHVTDHPSLVADRKFHRYFIANMESTKLPVAVLELVNYIDSSENLYPQVETEIIELLADLDFSKFPIELMVLIEDLAYRLFKIDFKKHKEPMSQFTLGISAFLLFRCDSKYSKDVAIQYLAVHHESEYVRKCWAIVGLLCKDKKVKAQLLKKLKAETSIEMKRLDYMMSNLKTLRKSNVLRRYVDESTFYLWGDRWTDSNGIKHEKEIKLKHEHTRLFLVKEILRSYR